MTLAAAATVTVSVGGVPVSVLRTPSAGPAVVLLHGASGSAETWRPLLADWSWADLWCPDLPGRGGSVRLSPQDRVAALADGLARLLDAAGLEAPILVGHSLGGAVALTLALQDRRRLHGLVLASSSARLRVSPAILSAVAASTPARPFRLDVAFGQGTPDAVVAQYAALSASVPPATALADWQACDAFDVRAQLSDLRCPTLVVYGADDTMTPPKHQHGLVAAIAGAQRVEVPGAGHMLPWEAPAALPSAVQAWLQTI